MGPERKKLPPGIDPNEQNREQILAAYCSELLKLFKNLEIAINFHSRSYATETIASILELLKPENTPENQDSFINGLQHLAMSCLEILKESSSNPDNSRSKSLHNLLRAMTLAVTNRTNEKSSINPYFEAGKLEKFSQLLDTAFGIDETNSVASTLTDRDALNEATIGMMLLGKSSDQIVQLIRDWAQSRGGDANSCMNKVLQLHEE